MTETGAGVDLAAHLSLAVGTIGKLAESIDRTRRDEFIMQPVWRAYAAQVTLNAAGFGAIDLGGPDMGHYWNVLNLVIGGLTPSTVLAGRADVFATAEPLNLQPTLAAIGLGDWRDQAAALPITRFYSPDQLHVGANENLYVIVSGSTAAQVAVAVAYVRDFQDARLRQEVAR